MPGKSLSPDQIAQAIAMRAAGYTITAISQALGVSVRTVSRIFERHATKKGAVKDELVETARRDLIETVSSNERVKQEAAKLIADDLAHVRLLRERMAVAAEHLTATNLEEAALVMRASAAYSTAIKNTSDALRHSLRTDKALDTIETTDMPMLTIMEITAEEAMKMHRNALEDRDDAPALPTPEAAPRAAAIEQDHPPVSEGDDDAT